MTPSIATFKVKIKNSTLKFSLQSALLFVAFYFVLFYTCCYNLVLRFSWFTVLLGFIALFNVWKVKWHTLKLGRSQRMCERKQLNWGIWDFRWNCCCCRLLKWSHFKNPHTTHLNVTWVFHCYCRLLWLHDKIPYTYPLT